MVNSIKKSDTSKFDEYDEIPEVDKDDTIAKKTLATPSFGIIKK